MLGIRTRGKTLLAVVMLATLSALTVLAPAATVFAQESGHHGGEASLALPDLKSVTFVGGIDGHTLLLFGLVICALGMAFGIAAYSRIRKLPVHQSMAEISELIYETCKTYLLQQGKFLIVLWIFIGAIVLVYFGIRINTLANSRTAFAALTGKPYSCYAIPLRAGMSIGMALISVELLIMLIILLFIPGDLAGPCF